MPQEQSSFGKACKVAFLGHVCSTFKARAGGLYPVVQSLVAVNYFGCYFLLFLIFVFPHQEAAYQLLRFSRFLAPSYDNNLVTFGNAILQHGTTTLPVMHKLRDKELTGAPKQTSKQKFVALFFFFFYFFFETSK